MTSENYQNPVFITGHPRSGTSLLYRTLLKHSSFAPKELCMEETKIFRYPYLALLDESERESLKRYMLNDEDLFNRYLKSIRPEYRFQRIFKSARLPSILLSDFTAWKFTRNPTVVQKYFYLALQARGCERIVEKTPIHLLNHRRITYTFPNASILIIFRHPIDVYSSYKKRSEEHPEMNWLKLSVEDFIEQYCNYSQTAEELSSSLQSYQFRYEDFVRNPVNSFQNLCNFLDEPFEEKPILEDEPALNIDGVNPNLSKSIQEKTKRWSDYISEEEAERIESGLEEEMNRYQYESVFQRSY